MITADLRPDDFEAGDILGFSGSEGLSVFINVVTYGIPLWDISHVGIIGEYQGQKVLFESTTLDSDPCLIQGKVFDGSKAHAIQHRIDNYRGKVWHYPLCRALYNHEQQRLNSYLLSTVGIPYDRIGAFRSGGLGFSWLEAQLRPPNLSALFCSEWCCAAHTDIGVFWTDNVGRWNPNRFVRSERKRGILKKPRRLK